MLRDPDLTIEEVTARLKVALSTLYRHFPAARASVIEG
jgi:AcrR family transcriptional regulator